MSIIDTLITDRTFDDVRFLTNKGIYRAEDLNRVEAAVKYVAGRLKDMGYQVQIANGPIWDEPMLPDFDQMERYLGNLAAIRSAAPTFSNTPQVPPDMDMLTYREANDIEQILVDSNHVINNIEAAWMYAGEVYTGEIV